MNVLIKFVKYNSFLNSLFITLAIKKPGKCFCSVLRPLGIRMKKYGGRGVGSN